MPTARDEGSSKDIAGQWVTRRNAKQQLLPAKINFTN